MFPILLFEIISDSDAEAATPDGCVSFERQKGTVWDSRRVSAVDRTLKNVVVQILPGVLISCLVNVNS